MIKNYILYGSDNVVTQFVKCHENEINLYGSSFIEYPESDFIFEFGYVYKVVNGQVIKIRRTDEEFIALEYKELKKRLVAAIEVTYNGTVYQGDEVSQSRLAKTISVLDDTDTVVWKAKDNNWYELTKYDLKQILLLACNEQTRILVEGK